MGEYVLKIEKLENGFEVEICDEKIMAANQKPKTAWKDPWKGYAFENVEGVVEFVKKTLGTLKPPPNAEAEYGKAFEEASKED